MRASAPAMKAIDVWDVLVTAITQVGSIGEVLDDLTAVKIAFIDGSIVAIPLTRPQCEVTQGTLGGSSEIIFDADIVVNTFTGEDTNLELLTVYNSAIEILIDGDGACHSCSLPCDGTNQKIRNISGAGKLYQFGYVEWK